MWTTPEPPLAIKGVSAATLRQLANAFRAGQLASPLTPFSLATVTGCPAALALDLQRLTSEAISGAHLALLLDVAADAVEARMLRDSAAELVWSGPEAPQARSRDTRVVLDELFSSAQRSVLVSTYVIQHPDRIFAALGDRLDTVSAIVARIFLNVEPEAWGYASGERTPSRVRQRPRGQVARYETTRGLLRSARPLDGSRGPRLVARQCVLVDDEVGFVTSANFTEWAQDRNVEAGALIRSR